MWHSGVDRCYFKNSHPGKGLKMRIRIAQKLRQEQKGITGLETAIILIAFVVVAAVFAYAVLSAGLFSSQKSQEAVYKGIEEAQSTTKILGGIISKSENTGITGNLSQLSFTISNTLGGQALDFTPPNPNPLNNGLCAPTSPNKVVISLMDPYQKVDDLYWILTKVGHCNDDYLLDTNEQFQITVGSAVTHTDGGNLVDALFVRPLGANTMFTLQITTPVGATNILERTTPAYIDKVMNLK
jgi:archaeal flagellin FlaB